MVSRKDSVVFSLLLPIIFSNTCESIKCYDCNSVNNSACLDLNLQTMHSILPIVDCGKTLPDVLSKHFFCRKMVQTILHPEKTPEVRVLRGCGWVKHKKECYKADNADHLETVCQCFGDMCNTATSHKSMTVVLCVAALLLAFTNWRAFLMTDWMFSNFK